MVNLIEKIKLGGVDQWYVVRGRNSALPLLLFLHGGPGSPQTGAQKKFNQPLEDHFLVVNWDQRGAGKSYRTDIPPETMNTRQLLADAQELILHLLDRFEQKKIFIMGHSMGALLGLQLVEQQPDLVQAFVGINQPINRIEEEMRSYHFVLEEAKKRSNRKAIRDLERIGSPVNGSFQSVEDLVTQRSWLTKFSGVTYQKSAMWINLQYIMSSHLTWKERTRFMKGFAFSTNTMWEELNSTNLFDRVKKLEVPVYFIMGRYDRIAHDTVEQFFQIVEAPKKELIISKNLDIMPALRSRTNLTS